VVQKRLLFVMFMVAVLCCLIHTDSARARGMSPVNLNLIPTAETLGKGGYSLSVGMFPSPDDVKSKKTREPMDINIGGFFKEQHDVKLQSDIWLIPSRVTYGISERLDFTFGGTYSAGDAEKIISDYYETGDDSKRRVYPQVVLDGLMGAKYSIQPASATLPALAVGGEFQMGYTVDDGFIDDTLEDSFPFVAMQIYMSAGYDFEIASVHGGLGMFLSSESIQSAERFDLPIQAGVEIPFDGFAAVLDIALFEAFSGIGLENIVSAGLRYDISSRATLNASVASVGGFLVRLTVGGKRPVVTAPPSAPALF
jgi:hypothetical protein